MRRRSLLFQYISLPPPFCVIFDPSLGPSRLACDTLGGISTHRLFFGLVDCPLFDYSFFFPASIEEAGVCASPRATGCSRLGIFLPFFVTKVFTPPTLLPPIELRPQQTPTRGAFSLPWVFFPLVGSLLPQAAFHFWQGRCGPPFFSSDLRWLHSLVRAVGA